MTILARSIRASTPWEGTGGKQEVPVRGAAPRQEVPYRCERGCEFTLTFAATAEVPDLWDCHCGKPARRVGAPEGAQRLPAYATPGTGKYERAGTDVTPMGQLQKRRTRKQGDAILAEALERARQTGAAR